MNGRPWLKRLLTWRCLLTACLLFALIFVGLKVKEWVVDNWLSGHEVAYEDQLLQRNLFTMTEPEDRISNAEKGREVTEDVEIDGKPGKLSKGWYANGDPWYEVRRLHGRQHGLESHWNAAGQKIEEKHWKDGALHGQYTRWYANGQKAEEAGYETFRQHGPHTTWYGSGKESSRTTYRSGLREGLFEAWHPNGQLFCRARYTQDKLDGLWEKWDEDGELIKQVEYKDGKVVSQKPQGRQRPYEYPGRLGAEDFSFTLAQGSGLDGYATFRVSSEGKCEFLFFVHKTEVKKPGEGPDELSVGDIYIDRVWLMAEFTLTDAMQRQLRQAIEEAELYSLKDRYIDERVQDGTQWIVMLRAGRKEKRIYCSNKFPKALRKLSVNLRESIVTPHKMELLTAGKVLPKETMPDELGWLEGPGR